MAKTKALDLAGWRCTQTETDPKGGIRRLTQATLAKRLGINPQHLCRIESGERWPGDLTLDQYFHVTQIRGPAWPRLLRAQLRTWRAYSPDRKGRTP